MNKLLKTTSCSIIFLLLSIFLASQGCVVTKKTLPKGFKYIKNAIPNVVEEIRYATAENFIGKPIDSYFSHTSILSNEAMNALIKVQKELNVKGQGLKIFDAYRPQSAVNHFIRWAKMPEDTVMKSQYYPGIPKSRLFELGYISKKSGHTRGSTLDLTIIDMKSGRELDMGGPYDFFGEKSHHDFSNITAAQIKNRKLLKSTMEKYGFKAYSEEWWHYSLRGEPYPDTYFDFPVK